MHISWKSIFLLDFIAATDTGVTPKWQKDENTWKPV